MRAQSSTAWHTLLWSHKALCGTGVLDIDGLSTALGRRSEVWVLKILEPAVRSVQHKE